MLIFGLGIWLFAFVVWIVCAAAGASIAQAKGNSGCAGAALGFFLGPLGLLIAALLPASPHAMAVANNLTPGPMGQCVFCMSLIPLAARVCRFCHRDLHTPEAAEAHRALAARAHQPKQLQRVVGCIHDWAPYTPTKDVCRRCGKDRPRP
jgi:hypothetical protein